MRGFREESMQTTVPLAALVVMAVVFVLVVLVVAALARRALRQGVKFRAEIQAASLFRFSVSTSATRDGALPRRTNAPRSHRALSELGKKHAED
jgi:hypothetical protein